jgi:hypothetical protein
MKKKIIAILTLIIMTISLCACGGPTPTETVDTFLNGIKAQDNETVKSVYSDDEFNFAENLDLDEEDGTELNKVFSDKLFPMLMEFEYTLSNEVIDNDKATVDVTIKTYNFGNAFSSFFSNYLTQAFAMAFNNASEEDMDKLGADLLSKELNNLTEMNTEKTTTVHLSATEDGWIIDKLDEKDEFYDALTGGMVSTIETLNESFDD